MKRITMKPFDVRQTILDHVDVVKGSVCALPYGVRTTPMWMGAGLTDNAAKDDMDYVEYEIYGL